MAQVDIEKAKKLLSLGIPQVDVAGALGCTEGFISQLLSDPKFAGEVAQMKLLRLEGASVRDEKLDALEDEVIKKLESSLRYILKPMELLKALETLAKIPRIGTQNNAAQNNALGMTVQIVLPNAMATTYIKNSHGEIIEADGRALTTLSSNALKTMVQSKSQLQLAGSGGSNGQQSRESISRNKETSYAGA